MPGYVKPPVNGRINGATEMVASTTSQIPLTIKGASGQSALLLDIENSAGASLAYFDSTGRGIKNNPAFLIHSGAGTGQAYHPSGWVDISRFPTSLGTGTANPIVNIGNNWNPSNGIFTAPVSGRYMFFAGGWTGYNGAGNRYAVCFNINNGPDRYITGANTSAGDTPIAVSPIVYNLSAGDFITTRMFSSVAMNLGGSTHVIYYGGYLLG